ncbi:DEAD/DEAH box helicase [Mycoplasmoides pirum]|uniref:DEAD/DEAH box helicase n=1 Tax=Mycoplasmoides pirum TaxID=2122 RepID=UPI0006990316|nr:DEAD/DEAH box helicase [Mycoplasmoides pirum]
MNKSSIEEFAKSEIVFIKGQNLVNRNRVIAKNSSKKENYYIGKVFDLDDVFQIELVVEKNKILSFSCTCNLDKPCFHIIGVLIKLFIQPHEKNNNVSHYDLIKQKALEKKKQDAKNKQKHLDKKINYSYKKLDWNKGSISFTQLHINFDNNQKISQFSFQLTSGNKIFTPICSKKIFKNINNKNGSLLISLLDHSSYEINSSAFNELDLKILRFLIENQLSFKNHRNYELRNNSKDTFWINRKVIFNLINWLKSEYKIKDNLNLSKFLEEKSDSFRMIMDSPNKYILYKELNEHSKYHISLMIQQSNKKWISISEVNANKNGQLLWADPTIQFWKNKKNLEVVSLVENTLVESYFFYYFNNNIKNFKYTTSDGKNQDIFDFIPKTIISLIYNDKEKIIKHRIKYVYPGSPSFSVFSTDDNSSTNKKRLWIYEKSIINVLSSYFFGSKQWFIKSKKISTLKIKEFESAINDFKKYKQSPIAQYEILSNLTNELKLNFDYKNFKKISINDDKLIIKCDNFNLTLEELKLICKHYISGNQIYINDKFFINLISEKNKPFLDFWSKFDYYNATSTKLGYFTLPKYRIFDLYIAFKGNISLIKKHVEKNVFDLIFYLVNKKNKDFKVPLPFKNVLRPYQVDGFKWIKLLLEYNIGGVLADDMGLGKTIQIISVLYDAYVNNKIKKPSLIVVPTSLVHNWKVEFEKFAKELKICVIEGTAKERTKLIKSNKHNIEITSFSVFKKDIEYHNKKSYEFFILDEAQNIKNNNTNLKSCVKEITSKHNLALTGTPIVNNVLELWSIFDFVLPGLFGTTNDFANDYEKNITKDNNPILLERLKQKVNTFVLRRTKEKVLTELPPKTQTDILVTFTPEHKLFYEKWFHDSQNKIKELITKNTEKKKELNSIKLNVFTMINDLRQICCSPELKDKSFIGKNSKLETCLDLVNQAILNERKILIFTQYLGMIDILKSELNKRGIKYYVLSGSTKNKDRVSIVDKFNKDKTPIFLSTLKTGGVGLNLVGAEIVIHYDLWWNLAIQNQATDRVHRIGQKKPVNVYRLITKDSIEQKIVAIQENKRHLIKSIISDNEENILSKISLEELIELFDIDIKKTLLKDDIDNH